MEKQKAEYPIIVKIKINDDGEKQKYAKWHYVVNYDGAERAFCTGEVFGEGEGRAVYDKKRGKITCEQCIEYIKMMKKVRL